MTRQWRFGLGSTLAVLGAVGWAYAGQVISDYNTVISRGGAQPTAHSESVYSMVAYGRIAAIAVLVVGAVLIISAVTAPTVSGSSKQRTPDVSTPRPEEALGSTTAGASRLRLAGGAVLGSALALLLALVLPGPFAFLGFLGQFAAAFIAALLGGALSALVARSRGAALGAMAGAAILLPFVVLWGVFLVYEMTFASTYPSAGSLPYVLVLLLLIAAGGAIGGVTLATVRPGGA
jgi:hypothetical protein